MSIIDDTEQETNEGPLLDNVDDVFQEQVINEFPPEPEEEGKPHKIGFWELLTKRTNKTQIYVLCVCLITYMFNQVDRYLIAVTSKRIQKSQGWGPGDGTGSKYDFLVGSVFTAVYLPSGIPMSMLADRVTSYRHYFLALALIVWSLSVVWTGFSTNYYEVVGGRFVLAFAQSACTPLAVSIITDFFPKDTRATALGVYNWGIYTGYSLAQGLGNAGTELAGWRFVWIFFGILGCAWSLTLFFIPMRKARSDTTSTRKSSIDKEKEDYSLCQFLIYFLTTPSIVLLLIGSLIRNAGGYVWAFNTKTFFQNRRDQSNYQIASFMGWIPLVCGSLGSVFGGFISDRYVKNSSSYKRLMVLILSNLCAAPFAFLALVIPQAGYPAFYLSLIPSNIIGEMWVGVTLTVIVELVPKHMKTTGLSIYFFIIGLAGFFPEAVTPLTNAFHSYQLSLIVLFPGLYAISSLFFFLAFFFVERDRKKAKLMEKQSIGLLSEED